MQDKEELLSKIQLLHLKIGHAFYRLAFNYINKGFKIEKREFDRERIKNIIRIQNLANSYSLADERYYLTDWQTWKKIIKYDWIDKKKYHRDYFDCDNFAFVFSANASFFYGLNSCGVAFGVINKEYAHCFNVIFALENEKVKTIIYEPIRDGFVEYDQGKPIKIGNWTYKINWLFMF